MRVKIPPTKLTQSPSHKAELRQGINEGYAILTWHIQQRLISGGIHVVETSDAIRLTSLASCAG